MRVSIKTLVLLLLSAVVGSAITYSAIQLVNTNVVPCEQVTSQNEQQSVSNMGSADNGMDIDQVLKDLRTQFIGDSRSIAEKLRDFLAKNHTSKDIAIASKVIVDMAENSEMLPDADIDSLYQHQTDMTLKRVLAQVLSLRGDNRLLDTYIAHLQKSLHNTAPAAQQKTLVELAKTHYVGAVSLIEPLLHSDNSGVILDALLALRATGNESHLAYAEALVNHPDQSISWLANDVINQLQYLSKKARTRLILADIAAELPPL